MTHSPLLALRANVRIKTARTYLFPASVTEVAKSSNGTAVSKVPAKYQRPSVETLSTLDNQQDARQIAVFQLELAAKESR